MSKDRPKFNMTWVSRSRSILYGDDSLDAETRHDTNAADLETLLCEFWHFLAGCGYYMDPVSTLEIVAADEDVYSMEYVEGLQKKLDSLEECSSSDCPSSYDTITGE